MWALGITCIELGENRLPNETLSQYRVMRAVAANPPPTLDKKKGRWSETFHDFVAHCLVKNPKERSSVKDLLAHPFVAKFHAFEGESPLCPAVRRYESLCLRRSKRSGSILHKMASFVDRITGKSLNKKSGSGYGSSLSVSSPSGHFSQSRSPRTPSWSVAEESSSDDPDSLSAIVEGDMAESVGDDTSAGVGTFLHVNHPKGDHKRNASHGSVVFRRDSASDCLDFGFISDEDEEERSVFIAASGSEGEPDGLFAGSGDEGGVNEKEKEKGREKKEKKGEKEKTEVSTTTSSSIPRSPFSLLLLFLLLSFASIGVLVVGGLLFQPQELLRLLESFLGPNTASGRSYQ